MKVILLATAIVALLPNHATAPQPAAMTGFSPTAAETQRRVERDAIARPHPDSVRTHVRVLSRESHVAGTPAQVRTRDYVLAQMKRWGLETESREYSVWLPHPTAVRVSRVSPAPRSFDLREPAIPGDPTSTLAQYPTVNGYSGQGDVTAELVFVNYGLIEDYAYLDSIGVSVRGRIAVARYGRSFRGIKAREAEKNGAVGLILYSDPKDDGFVVGDVFPDGPMRPAGGVQRGSVMNGNGDPATPGYASVSGAPRLAEADMQIPRIPVVPMSYGNAAELLRHISGREAPAGWQGGLDFRYRIGPGTARARMVVEDDRATRAMKSIFNTFGTIRGTDFADELVIIGAHRDGWGPGAADNVSGTVSVLEAARAIADAVKAGARPRRTIVFATWDAEEWGLIGSTEYVEQDSARLVPNAVAYLNQDVAAQGPTFGSGGSPSLRATMRDVVRQVPHPSGQGSVWDAWQAANPAGVPPMGDPGGGSDFAGFYNHLGIPHLDWGFGGRGGVYHSHYDDLNWMTRFGDPGFRHHAAAARIAAATILRLANADVIPYDYVEFARTMKGYVPGVERSIAARGWTIAATSLSAAFDTMEATAARFASERDAALQQQAVSAEAARRVNAELRQVERALTRPEGLRTRPWVRSLTYAADENNGYSNMPLPSINEAIRAGDAAIVEREIADLAGRIAAATTAIERARVALRGR